jgi:hypothetical protein
VAGTGEALVVSLPEQFERFYEREVMTSLELRRAAGEAPRPAVVAADERTVVVLAWPGPVPGRPRRHPAARPPRPAR